MRSGKPPSLVAFGTHHAELNPGPPLTDAWHTRFGVVRGGLRSTGNLCRCSGRRRSWTSNRSSRSRAGGRFRRPDRRSVVRPSPIASAPNLAVFTSFRRTLPIVDGWPTTRTRRARRPASLGTTMRRGLPGAARRAGALAGVGTGAADRAGGGVLGDRERAAGLRRRHDAVTLRTVRRDRDTGQVAGRNL